MSNALLLAPHSDDETLFAAYLAQKYEADLIVVLRSFVQEERGYGITWRQREEETNRAWQFLNGRLSWRQWDYTDNAPPWGKIVVSIDEAARDYDILIAPAIEDGGNMHHNSIGEIAYEAADSWGIELVRYLTYTPEGRSTGGHRVEPEPDWIVRKLRALSCYESQIHEPSCRPHFERGLDEYTEDPLP